VTTGGQDSQADRLVVVVIPLTSDPPIALGWSSVPAEMAQHALATVIVDRGAC
jgi:hypothetical protein